jgi:hypothetical protein
MSLADGRRALRDLGFDSLRDALDEVKRLRQLLQHPATAPAPDEVAEAGADEGGGDGSGGGGEEKGDDTEVSEEVPGADDPPRAPFTMRSALSYEHELEELRLKVDKLEASGGGGGVGGGGSFGVEDLEGGGGGAGAGHVVEKHGRGRKGYATLSTTEEAGGDSGVGIFTVEGLLKVPLWHVLRQRLVWLVLLLLFQSSTAAIMDSVEDILSRHIVLTLFVPMLVGAAGNAGIQPGVVVTRALGAGA